MEFIPGIIKIVAVLRFIIFSIIVDVGGVPSDDRGYIGFGFWSDSATCDVAFKNVEMSVEGNRREVGR